MTEAEYLLACLRATCAPDGASMPPPPANLDSSAFLSRCWREGILLALLPLIETMPAQDPASTALADEVTRLREPLREARQRGLNTLGDVVQALGGAGIPFLILKGPALALRLHGSRPVRLYGDLDVLVPTTARRVAFEALLGDEYHAVDTAWVRYLVWRFHFHSILDAYHASRMRIELHWNLVDRCNLYRIPEHELFERRQTLDLVGMGVPTLSLEDDFLYLSVHAAKHGVLNKLALDRGEPPSWYCGRSTGNRLRWFHDLHFFLQHFEKSLDWSILRQRARAWNVEEDVETTLRVLSVLLPALAESALARLGGDGAARSMPSERPIHRFARSRFGRRLLSASLAVNRRFSFRPVRILVLARTLFPSRARLARYYAGASGLKRTLLYLSHPLRMLMRQLSSPWLPLSVRRFGTRLITRFFYASQRRHLRYYGEVMRLTRIWGADARSALDVGPYDVDLLERLDWILDRTAIDLRRKPRLAGTTNIKGDFLSWQPGRVFDLVLCLQVLEHLDSPAEFAAKLLATGRTVIISVPYRWPAGTCATHKQDPVDEEKLLSWTCRGWEDKQIVTEASGVRRLIAVFEGSPENNGEARGRREVSPGRPDRCRSTP